MKAIINGKEYTGTPKEITEQIASRSHMNFQTLWEFTQGVKERMAEMDKEIRFGNYTQFIEQMADKGEIRLIK
jgi:hypothetical protein